MRVFLILTISSIFFGCATRTKYQPMNGSGGYADKEVADGVYLSRFAGNAHTNETDAQHFSMFRAVEVCRKKGYKLAVVLDYQNKSTSRTVQKSSNYNYKSPQNLTGTANTTYNSYSGYNTKVNAQVSGGNSYGSTTTWNETYNFPTYDVTYQCANEVLKFGIGLNNLDADKIATHVKDHLGAIQVIEVTGKSPNYGIAKVGDIILKLDDERTISRDSFEKVFQRAKSKKKISAQVVREGRKKTILLNVADFSHHFSGSNEKALNYSCSVPEIMKRPICGSYRSVSSE